MTCSACGSATRSGAKFCTNCGVAVARFCPACEHANLPTDRFCAECGASLVAAPRHLEPRDAGGGRLAAAARLYRAILRDEDHRDPPTPVFAAASAELGDVLRERNELTEAADVLRGGVAASRRANLIETEIDCLTGLGRVLQAAGQPRDGNDALASAEQLARHHRLGAAAARVAASKARVALRQGRLDAAARWAHDADIRSDRGHDAARFAEQTTLIRVLTAQGTPSLALGLLERLLQAAEAARNREQTVELLALQAPALHVDGARLRALRVMERALALAEPDGYVRLFVDEGSTAAGLLSALEAAPRPGMSAGSVPTRAYVARLARLAAGPPEGGERWTPVEPLGEREREVLRLIAAGRSNDQIARELILAVGTVKWYVRSIYQKLDVHSRTQAVARATELRLLVAAET